MKLKPLLVAIIMAFSASALPVATLNPYPDPVSDFDRINIHGHFQRSIGDFNITLHKGNATRTWMVHNPALKAHLEKMVNMGCYGRNNTVARKSTSCMRATIRYYSQLSNQVPYGNYAAPFKLTKNKKVNNSTHSNIYHTYLKNLWREHGHPMLAGLINIKKSNHTTTASTEALDLEKRGSFVCHANTRNHTKGGNDTTTSTEPPKGGNHHIHIDHTMSTNSTTEESLGPITLITNPDGLIVPNILNFPQASKGAWSYMTA